MKRDWSIQFSSQFFSTFAIELVKYAPPSWIFEMLFLKFFDTNLFLFRYLNNRVYSVCSNALEFIPEIISQFVSMEKSQIMFFVEELL